MCAYNRTVSKVDDFLANEAKGTRVIGAHSIDEMMLVLKRPRKIMLMVKAGTAVDDFIQLLLPHLTAGDIIIDGGNSLYIDTERRVKELQSRGILFVGCGVSGGEEGARRGPSLMPGGNPAAWPLLKDMFQSIAAKADDGLPCCDWVGDGGAGHFVKMVHNGIEYGDMQLICEAYHLMRDGLALSIDEMADAFDRWNREELDSFLIEITRDILRYKDPKDGLPVIERIRDAAGQKGTGKWTVEAALEMGAPMTLVSEAVFARAISSLKDERVRASKILSAPQSKFTGDKNLMLTHVKNVLFLRNSPL